jgi:hypothetical protein
VPTNHKNLRNKYIDLNNINLKKFKKYLDVNNADVLRVSDNINIPQTKQF